MRSSGPATAGARSAAPAGPIPALLPPGGFDGYAPRMDPVPALGEHTDTVLAGLGFSSSEIDHLHREGAL